MAVERLAFENPSVPYHSYHSAEHVVRYASVKDIVAGKRVLDVACGEGYGARLLLEWGAREVVGVEISPAAVATAKRQFGDEGATFLVGDVEMLGKVLADAEPFDLVVSFETIEHLARPDDFLASLPGMLAPGGVIAISCPNDSAYTRGAGDNPFHMRAYSFDDFQSLTERHLGKATMWLLGTPLLGELNFRPGDDFVEHAHHDQAALLDTRTIENTLVLPAQSNLTTNAAQCSHYIGVWGAEVCPNAVVSSLSVSEYQAPWQQVAYLGSQLAEQERQRAEHYEPEIVRLTEANARLESERNTQLAVNAELEAALDALQKERAEWYEPELARLKSHVEHSKFEKETQLLRRRVMAYADQMRRIAGSVVELEAKLAELERVRDSWFVPELGRLSEIIEQYENTKTEWFEPQLESHSARIAVLEQEIRIRDDLIQNLEKKASVSTKKSGAGLEKPLGLLFRLKR